MSRRVLLVFLFMIAAGAFAWGVLRLVDGRRSRLLRSGDELSAAAANASYYSWDAAVEKVKAERDESLGGTLEIPSELKHYEDRYWFLATQVAEIEKYRVHTCQDYLDLAAMLERQELVPVSAATATYVLFGVGQKADDEPFTRFAEQNHSIEIYSESQLNEAYRQLDERLADLQEQIKSLHSQAGKLTSRERSKRNELQKKIGDLGKELKTVQDDRSDLEEFYGQPEARQQLFGEYQSLEHLARNFNGRSYDLNTPSGRYALKMNMLSSIRPQALKIIEEVAAAYHRQFDRPLPISSLVRPEQYQHVLRRVNRNAVTIDTPPHSTGLAFDIDYRYMSVAEQNFLMTELARIKNEGRIEVLRERRANYHVFAFMNGARPADYLISASLEKAGAPPEDPDKVEATPKTKSPQSRSANKGRNRKRRR